MRFATLSTAASLLLAGIASAQGFNVDAGIFNPVPNAAFGAAAAQPGVWNQLPALTVGGVQPLVNLAGAASGVVVTLTAGAPPTAFSFNNTLTAGDDELLMDDGVDPGTLINAVYTFSGLAAGSYDVYTYAWAPDSATFFSDVSINGLPSQIVGGTWPGGYTLGVTHALHNVTITAGQNIVLTIFESSGFATFDGIQIKPLGGGAVGTAECIGDTVAACPCSGAGGSLVPNPGAAGNGCANSSFAAGANLSATGNALDNAGDTLVLTCNNMPGPGLFFQSNGLAGPVVNFNDGVLCAAVGIIRMGVVFPTAGVASYPGGLTPSPIHIAGAPVLLNGSPTPATKHYQCWYRDITVGFCNTAGHNMSNGLAIVWAP